MWTQFHPYFHLLCLHILVKTVSKMTQFHFLKANDSWNIPFSPLLWHPSCVMDALYMPLYRCVETVTWRNSRRVSWSTTRWLKRSRKKSVRILIFVFYSLFEQPGALQRSSDDAIPLTVWRRPEMCLNVCVCVFFFLISSQSQPASWVPLSSAHWAHLSSTATTCRWSTHPQRWVPATIVFSFINVITAVLSNCH